MMAQNTKHTTMEMNEGLHTESDTLDCVRPEIAVAIHSKLAEVVIVNF